MIICMDNKFKFLPHPFLGFWKQTSFFSLYPLFKDELSEVHLFFYPHKKEKL